MIKILSEEKEDRFTKAFLKTPGIQFWFCIVENKNSPGRAVRIKIQKFIH
jgi:hypothetical protein